MGTKLLIPRFWSIGGVTSSERLPEVSTVGKLLLLLLPFVHSFQHNSIEAVSVRGVVIIKPAGWVLAQDGLGLDLSMLGSFLFSVTRAPNNLKGRMISFLSCSCFHGYLTLFPWTGCHEDGIM